MSSADDSARAPGPDSFDPAPVPREPVGSGKGGGMRIYVALFRGINVGGRNLLPMKKLAESLESLGLTAVRTYIQSGNVVFGCPTGAASTWAKRIQGRVKEEFGFEPEVVLLPARELEAAAAANPYPKAASDPKLLHLFVLVSKPKRAGVEALEALRTDDERFHLAGRMLYLHLPSGVAGSKLAAGVEKALGVSATGRNWRTVTKILELAAR